MNSPNLNSPNLEPQRNHRKRWIALAATIALALPLAALAREGAERGREAFRHHHGEGRPHGLRSADPATRAEHLQKMSERMLSHLERSLDLSADQKAAAERLIRDLGPKMMSAHEEAGRLHEQMVAGLESGAPAEQIGQLAQQAYAIHQRLKGEMTAAHREFAGQLDPEQREKFESTIEKIGDRHGGFAGFGRFGGIGSGFGPHVRIERRAPEGAK